jgi:hypothetical protein
MCLNDDSERAIKERRQGSDYAIQCLKKETRACWMMLHGSVSPASA